MAQVTLNDSDLQGFLAKHASDVLYFDQAWLHLITSLYGYTLIPLTTTNSRGQLTGFLLLCYIQSAITGRRLVSLPFADHCPLLAEDEASANELIDQAIQIAQQKKAQYLELRTGFHEALARRADLAAGNLYARWLIPLDPNPDTIWSRLPGSVRRHVKKARNLGVRVRTAESREEMSAYYHLHLRTRTRKHGMPSQSLQFFLQLWDAFAPRGLLRLELAEFDKKVVAASITAICDKTAHFLYGASDERFLFTAANNLLTWESIAWCCQHGCQTLDQGRTAYDNPGLMQYKRHWAAVEEPMPYYYYPAVRGLASTPEASPKYRLLTRCWRTLPLCISGPLGARLYRHLG